MNENYEKRISDVVKDRHWKFWKKLTPESRLEADLGISGEDATEFMAGFFKEFQIDSTGFEVNDYFHPEGFDSIANIILSPFSSRNLPKCDITLRDLAESIERGSWK